MAALHTAMTGSFGRSSDMDPSPPILGRDYLIKLRKYFAANLPRLAPPPTRPNLSSSSSSSWLQQSYTLLTLGLDPNSAPLSRNVKVPLTLGFGTPVPPKPQANKPVLLRLPPDKLLYLLLRWQSLPQGLAHVGRTDVPIASGVAVAAHGSRVDGRERRGEGDVESVQSWVGSMRSVSMASGAEASFRWFGRSQEVDEDKILLELYSIMNTLPGLLIHPPFNSDRPVAELLEAGGYTQLGGVDVRVPLDVLRNLQILELEAYDPRGLLVPPNPALHSLTVRNVQDGDDWVNELIIEEADKPRFPNLRYLSLYGTSLLSFPPLPLTSLTHLDLSHNLLNAIPDSLAALHNLVSLNLSSNLITSVRNAPSTLGNIHTLNLARNRINCLVGLERVPGLRRVDVRSNLLVEYDEVGRLAVLPQIDAVWVAENPFTRADDWRTNLGAAFAAEGVTVILDDQPLSWSEQRRVDTLLATRGQTRHPNATPTTLAHISSPSAVSSPTRTIAPSHSRHSHHPQQLHSTASPASDPSSVPKRRRRRRVVKLDGVEDSDDSLESPPPVGGSLRLPKPKTRRDRVSASMFEPNPNGS